MKETLPTPPPAPQDTVRPPHGPTRRSRSSTRARNRRSDGGSAAGRASTAASPRRTSTTSIRTPGSSCSRVSERAPGTRNREGALRWGVHNSWLEELRKRRRRPAVTLDAAPEAALVADCAADPAERAELLEAARYLFESVRVVTDRQWQIFLLADIFGLRPRETQQRLGISERLYQLDHARVLQAIGDRLGELRAGDWCEQHRGPLDAHAAAEASPSEVR
jgi:hypothetical protein